MTGGGSNRYQRQALALQKQQYEEMKRLEENKLTEEERKRIEAERRRAKGRTATILTSGMGVLEAPATQRKTLFGE